MSLRRLALETIDLYQLHRIDPQVPLEDQVGALADMQTAGKIRHIGLSEVGVKQIRAARQIAPIVSVQNLYNLVNRSAEPVLEYCEREGIGFIPWFPIANRALAKPDGPVGSLATELGATPSQLALAWLLRRSPVMLPIPGTSSLEHLEENVAAAGLDPVRRAGKPVAGAGLSWPSICTTTVVAHRESPGALGRPAQPAARPSRHGGWGCSFTRRATRFAPSRRSAVGRPATTSRS
jgi:pyridoxine 4-dehydrogenase